MKFSDITNNESSNNELSSNNGVQGSRSRAHSRSPKDREK